jgi:hypothetical protein
MASTAVVAGKPFVVSEWNEYGLYPFHSTAFVSTAAYACLNDWDGLIVYCYHTSESWNDQPPDEITNIFDAYNDPSLICQFGFMAAMFLKGLVRPAEHRVDLVFTRNDLLTLPPVYRMANSYLPYITALRNVFLDCGDAYTGDADVAVTSGFLNNGDLSQAKRAVYYAWSPYKDAFRRAGGGGRLECLSAQTDEILPGAKLGEKTLVFDTIAPLVKDGDYTAFAGCLDRAFKRWGVLPEDRGLIGNALVSDTGELAFNGEAGKFSVHAEGCSYFSGNPEGGVTLAKNISLKLTNNRISAALLPIKHDSHEGAETFLLTIIGASGMDESVYTTEGYLTTVEFKGKLYADTPEGTLFVRCRSATLEALDMTGKTIAAIEGAVLADGISFALDGTIPAVHFLLTVTDMAL